MPVVLMSCMFYYDGIATLDHVLAAKWYRKAADLDSATGQERLVPSV